MVESELKWALAFVINSGQKGKAHIVHIDHNGNRVAKCRPKTSLKPQDIGPNRLERFKREGRICMYCERFANG